MPARHLPCVVGLALALPALAAPAPPRPRTIHVVNDACSDYTWGFDEAQTRRNMAELVRAHLDAMARTDGDGEAVRDRYTMSVANEALAFLERYPERREELARRLGEGRMTLSPFLDNSLWAGQSDEAFLRTLYPARRLEREWGVPIDVAHHIELPSLPWGAATLLAGAGVRWLAVPFLDYDTEWSGLDVPPLFVLEGPDGARIRVVLDPWASRRSNYTQGRALLEEPGPVAAEWLARFDALGTAYPFSDVLAIGTHGDLGPQSAGEASRFVDAVRAWNARPDAPARLVNDTVAGFCRAIDSAEGRDAVLPVVRGDFGHSWESWPVSLAAHAAAARQAEREFLAAEALAALAGGPDLASSTREARERAEWSWAMLGDHAWNGTDDANRRVNSSLRRRWAASLVEAARELEAAGWNAAGLVDRSDAVTLFNPSGFDRRDVVRFAVPPGPPRRRALDPEGHALPSQAVLEDGHQPVLYFTPPALGAWATATLGLAAAAPPPATALRATPTRLEGPFYRLTLDPRTGGLSSLVHVPTGRELVVAGSRTLGQTAYFDGHEAPVDGVRSEVDAIGPVLARLRVSYRTGPARTDLLLTVYAAVDRVDFDYRVVKEPSPVEERLVHVFPVVAPGADVRLDTTGAVIRPRPSPEGDLVRGANTRRFAVQGFVDASSAAGGVTLAPLDSFLLRADLEPLSFEALGDDQNFKEVSRDQGGATRFRFRYALRAHASGYDGADAFAWSRAVATPVVARSGRLSRALAPGPPVDPARAIATGLKPPDDASCPGLVLRVRETAGRAETLSIAVPRRRRAVRLDLLEREREDLPVVDGKVRLELRAYGFTAVRLE